MKNKIFTILSLCLLFCRFAVARPFTDSADRTLNVPDKIERVVPSGPIAQMTLVALAPDRFAALSNRLPDAAKTFLPPEVLALPVIGQLYGAANLNAEELAVIDPQLFIDVGESKHKIGRDMNNMEDRLGIKTVHVNATLKNTAKSFLMLGELLGKEAEGKALADYTAEIYARTQKIMDSVKTKKRIIYLGGTKALSALAKGSYHGQVTDWLGENVAVLGAVSTSGGGNEVDFEQIAAWNPEIIIADAKAYAEIMKNPVWQSLSAVASKHVYRVPDKPYNWVNSPPAVNRFMGLIWLVKLLYPEHADYDLFAEAKKYYKLFYHTDLTREQFDELTAKAL